MNYKKDILSFIIIFFLIFFTFKKNPHIEYPIYHKAITPTIQKHIINSASYYETKKPKFVFVKSLFTPPAPKTIQGGLPSLQELLFGKNAAPTQTGPQLVGIVKKGNERIALIMMPGNKLKPLKVGQYLQDHVKVIAIKDYEVVLAYKKQKKVLKIYNTEEKKYEKK